MVGVLGWSSIHGRGAATENRREIMKFIGLGALLEMAEMIEQTDLGYRSTIIGTAYLKKFEAFDESSKIS